METFVPLYQNVWCMIIDDHRMRFLPFACLRSVLYSDVGEEFVHWLVSLQGQVLPFWHCPVFSYISKQVRTEAQNGCTRGYAEIGIIRIIQFITRLSFDHARLFGLT